MPNNFLEMTKLPMISPNNRYPQQKLNKKEKNIIGQKENILEINKTKGTIEYNLDNYSQYETRNFIKFKNRETFLNTKNIHEKFKDERDISITYIENQKTSKPFINIKNDSDLKENEEKIKDIEMQNDTIPKFRNSSFSDNTFKNTKLSIYSQDKENEKKNPRKNYKDISISNAFQSYRRFAETNTSYSRKDTFFNNLINFNESKGKSILEVDEKNSPKAKQYKDFMNTNPYSNKKENKTKKQKHQMNNINIRYMVDLANIKGKKPMSFSAKKINDDPTIYGTFNLNGDLDFQISNTKENNRKNSREDPKITLNYLSQALKTKNMEEEANLKRHMINRNFNFPKEFSKENNKKERLMSKNSNISNSRGNLSKNLNKEKDSSFASIDINPNISGFINELEISQNIIDPKVYIPFSEFADKGNSSGILRPFQLSKYKRVSNLRLHNVRKDDTYYNIRDSSLKNSLKFVEKMDKGVNSLSKKKK